MSITLEVGSRLSVTLWLAGEKLTAQGVVITRHPQFGNGIEFADMSEENQSKLASYLESIRQ